jgi:NADPH:quinone reductase
MHAIRHHRFGPPDVLVLDALPDLHPAAGQVRVAVEAAAGGGWCGPPCAAA